jgi:hypothetical protein
MSGNNSIGTISQDRIDKSEFLDARRDLLDLLSRVRARVVCPWLQLTRIFVNNLECSHGRLALTLALKIGHSPFSAAATRAGEGSEFAKQKIDGRIVSRTSKQILNCNCENVPVFVVIAGAK